MARQELSVDPVFRHLPIDFASRTQNDALHHKDCRCNSEVQMMYQSISAFGR